MTSPNTFYKILVRRKKCVVKKLMIYVSFKCVHTTTELVNINNFKYCN